MIPVYHLEIEAKYCKVVGLVNKFPIYSLDGTNPAIFSKPVNSCLIKTANILDLIVTPGALIAGKPAPYSIRGAIKLYSSDDVTGPDKGKIIKEFAFENQIAGTLTFDNNVFDFRSLLVDGKKIEDTKPLAEYAGILKKLLLAKGTTDVVTEFKSKLADYARCYGVDPDDMFDQFGMYLEQKYFPNNPRLDFKPEELIFTPWCDKRIWEIGVRRSDNEEAFLLTTVNERGAEYSTTVFVALVGNQLKVVR